MTPDIYLVIACTFAIFSGGLIVWGCWTDYKDGWLFRWQVEERIKKNETSDS